MANFDQELDASGLKCPLPIIKAAKTLNSLQSGQVLHVIATDPGSKLDFIAFEKQSGHQLLESREANGKYFYLLKKK
jgi:tRNA 2-thiouridine synthesizing protein A